MHLMLSDSDSICIFPIRHIINFYSSDSKPFNDSIRRLKGDKVFDKFKGFELLNLPMCEVNTHYP